MGALQTYDFDSPAVALMNENNVQLLQVTLQTKMRKVITDISASSYGQSVGAAADAMTAIARTNVRARILVVTGRIDLTGQSAANLLNCMNPLQAAIDTTVIPFGRILLDRVFINTFDMKRETPIEVERGDDVHIFMSQGLQFGDATLVSTVKIGQLNVGGFYTDESSPKIPWKLK